MNELLDLKQILYLSETDVSSLGVFDFDRNKQLCKDAFLAHEHGLTKMPKTEYLQYEECSAYDRIIVLPGYLQPIAVSAVKIIGSSITNSLRGFNRASALLVLLDSVTQRPFCIMEGAQISAARTVAVSAIALEHLSPKHATTVAIIGCGYLADIHVKMLRKLFFERFSVLRLFDIDPKASALLSQAARDYGFLVSCCDSAESAIKEAQIVLTCTTAETPYIESKWINTNSLYCAVSLLDPKLDVITESDLIVVDDLEHCFQEGRPLQTLNKLHKLNRENVLSIGAMLERSFRRTNQKRIFYNPMGTVITDLILGLDIFHRAKQQSIGTTLKI